MRDSPPILSGSGLEAPSSTPASSNNLLPKLFSRFIVVLTATLKTLTKNTNSSAAISHGKRIGARLTA
jgi:hypothetical protein